MKTRETKQKDLNALTESLKKSKSAMVVSFSKLSVNKDIEFRNSLREAGAEYRVVKNTLARIAVKGTDFEQATESFKGVTAIAWTENDPVILSKAISKFMKDNAEVYTFKSGVVDGRLVTLTQVQSIASLPSKEELISKLLWVLNAQAQRIVTVINAVPRNLAVVIKQIGEKAPAAPAVETKADDVTPIATEEAAPAATDAAPIEATEAEAPAAEAPATEVQEGTASQETPASDAVQTAADVPATEAQDEAASQETPGADVGEEEPPA
ncbi:MAG: 50S ribosomal protein L10 [Pyrinomonadaceae bacterium]